MGKIYFFLMAIFAGGILVFFVIEGDTSFYLYWIKIAAVLMSLVGMFGYLFKKTIGSKWFWLCVFLAAVFSHLYNFYLLFQSTQSKPFLLVFFSNIMFFPLHYAVFKYYRNFDLIVKKETISVSLSDRSVFGIGIFSILAFLLLIFVPHAIELRIRKIIKLHESKKYTQAYKQAAEYIDDYAWIVSDSSLAYLYFIQGSILIHKNEVAAGKRKFFKAYSYNTSCIYWSTDKRLRKMLLEVRREFNNKKDDGLLLGTFSRMLNHK